jgi:hypothetical protein
MCSHVYFWMISCWSKENKCIWSTIIGFTLEDFLNCNVADFEED